MALVRSDRPNLTKEKPMRETARAVLKLEVEQIENRARPGCDNSSTTSPLCTCPIKGPKV